MCMKQKMAGYRWERGGGGGGGGVSEVKFGRCYNPK